MNTYGDIDMIFCKLFGGRLPVYRAYDLNYSVNDRVCQSCNRCTKEEEEPEQSFIRKKEADKWQQ